MTRISGPFGPEILALSGLGNKGSLQKKKNCLNLELCQIRGGRGLPDPNFRKASEFGHPERGRGGLGQNSKLKFIILKG